MKHPFNDPSFEIKWSELKSEHVVPDIEKALTDAREQIVIIANQSHEALSFENTLLALEVSMEVLDYAWGKVGHLDGVCNTPELRKAYNTMLPKVSEFQTKLFLNPELWQIIKAYSETKEAKALEGVQKRFLEETIKDFKEQGADLGEADKVELESINAELAILTQKYSENVLDATNAWEYIVEDESELAGLPESAKAIAHQDALKHGQGDETTLRWRLNLQEPCVTAVLQYADNGTIREKVWRASNTVGHEAPFENTDLICSILQLRHKKAQLLGKKDFADFALQRRMASNGKKALRFTEDLHDRIKAHFNKEIKTLEAYKAKTKSLPEEHLEPWEMGYWIEKQRKALHAFDEEALRPYFQINRVIDGMFALVERLFGIELKERNAVFVKGGSALDKDSEVLEVWHPEVKYYDVFDKKTGEQLGAFYADWYPRDSKRQSAWMNHLKPHLGLICGNLTPSVEGKPSLLTHREVETIFHEFGHLLHEILSEVSIRSLRGVNVAWDFVELPSQIMENWCWERESLDLFARHHETGKAIPEDLFQKMLSVRNYYRACKTMRQLGMGKMDLELHMNYYNVSPEEIDACMEQLLETYMPPYKTKAPTVIRRFSHLFCNPTGYAAGYYSYHWAEVLDADAFTRFKKEGIMSSEVGHAFRSKILSQGNSRPASELFYDFMGREPDLRAFLERKDLLNKETKKVPCK